jgi:hypothetical protein
MRSIKNLSPLLLLAALAACASPAPESLAYQAAPPADIVVDSPPPAPYVEEAPAPPFAGALWVGGYWAWAGGHHGHHEWVAGHYEAPRAGYVLTQKHWDHQPDGQWALNGGWARQR